MALSAFISLLNKMFVRLCASASSFSLLGIRVVVVFCFSCLFYHIAYQFIFGGPRFWAMPLFLITSSTCYLIILTFSLSKKNWARHVALALASNLQPFVTKLQIKQSKKESRPEESWVERTGGTDHGWKFGRAERTSDCCGFSHLLHSWSLLVEVQFNSRDEATPCPCHRNVRGKTVRTDSVCSRPSSLLPSLQQC